MGWNHLRYTSDYGCSIRRIEKRRAISKSHSEAFRSIAIRGAAMSCTTRCNRTLQRKEETEQKACDITSNRHDDTPHCEEKSNGFFYGNQLCANSQELLWFAKESKNIVHLFSCVRYKYISIVLYCFHLTDANPVATTVYSYDRYREYLNIEKGDRLEVARS